jgi:glycosyltransferase involved in cell wall biosynthesis
MKIGIDARLYSQTGVGRYIRNIIQELAKIDKKNHYVVFLHRSDYDAFKLPNSDWKIKKTDIAWHSLAEQLIFPKLLQEEHCNLIHFPYFSIPIFYRGKFVVTIHDLIMNHFDTGHATSLPIPLYRLKRFGYGLVLKHAIVKSQKIITVSEATKREIIDHYHVQNEKIIVTYEASEPPMKSINKPHSLPRISPGNYILYVGNAYPHKNLNRLLRVFHTVKSQFPKLHLVLAGRIDYFYKRLEQLVKIQNVPDVIFTGEVDDSKLAWLYSNASCFILPSFMEGFGLPLLEAMSYGCPVLASNIPAVREICDQACIYFDPGNEEDIKDKIIQIINCENRGLRKKLIELGHQQTNKYSWETTVKETLQVYESCSGL